MPKPTMSSSDLEIRKGLGRAYLNSDRIDKAIETFAGILRDYPMDVDVSILLGDCYFAEGKTETASRLYAEALKLNPDHSVLEKRLVFLQQENGFDPSIKIEREVALADFDVLAGALQRMTNRTEPINIDEISRSADLLQKIISSPHPAQDVSHHLDEIDDLLPALLGMNIQQAHADGLPDLARALQNLMDNIYLQIGVLCDSENLYLKNIQLEHVPNDLKILFLCQKNGDIPPRIALATEALSNKGCETRILTDFSIEQMLTSDVICVSRPHVDSKLVDALMAINANGIPIIIDLEADFEQMSVEHHDYEHLGLSTLSKSKAFTTALLLADQVCVHSNYLATVLRNSCNRVNVIPDGWSKKNHLWDKPSASRHTLNLGWIGNSGQLEDLIQIRRILTRVIREFPHVRLVIGGDSEAYRMFESIPEIRRLFLPSISYENYPYLFNQIDVLLTPLRDIAYNRSLSDRWLMEAGVRSIPWVSSPLPTVVAWGSGGVVANTPEEWYSHIRQLLIDKNLRDNLGNSGRRRAEKREMNNLVDLWYWMISDTWQEKQVNN